MWNKDKDMKKNILLMAALMGALVLAGCQRAEEDLQEERPEKEVAEGTYFLTVEASKGVDTKALFLDTEPGPDVLTAYWKNTEKVKVFKAGSGIGQLDVAPGTGEKPVDATLSGEITVSGLTSGDALTLLIPRETWNYTGQVGTLADIESKYDYATATITVAGISGNTITTNDNAVFANQQSVYRFGFKIKDTETVVNVKEFTVSSTNDALVRACSLDGTATESGSITVTPASATTELIYAALRNTQAGTSTADTYSFNVIGSDNALYLGEKVIPATAMDAQGKFISAKSVEVSQTRMTAKSTSTSEVW